MTYLPNRLTGLIALTASVVLAGCANTGATPADSTAEVSKTTVHSSAPLLPAVLFPGSASYFDAWECQPANQNLVTAVNDDNLRLWSLHGAWRLPEAVVASGARYQDGEVSFWNRGDQAQVETPRGQLQCRQGQRRAAATRADHPGVMFLGRGNEPGWSIELAHDAPIMTWTTAYGSETQTMPYMVSVMDNEAGRVVIENANADQFFRVRIESGACFDDMKGQPYPARVTLTIGGEQYKGCGQGIAP
ncbi:MliC family protein [Halomonas qinghailakensis]|uniref:MliC family protein n=2 Tax=Halomonas TaxID=2745 RepID=A0AA46TNA7_9GAMM|nr:MULTISPECIES: MliC family protein [Halomonas]UYO73362.1 MliC family protein [Halomonas sp. ZZQ-149]UYV18542.1 MliC family protein [Halomonas qaidamensis]